MRTDTYQASPVFDNDGLITESVAYYYERDDEGNVIYTYIETEDITRQYDAAGKLVRAGTQTAQSTYY